VGFIKGGKIGVCVSKPAAAAAAAREEVVVRRVSPPPQPPAPAAAAAVAAKGHSGLLSNSKSGHPVLLSSKSGHLVGDSKRMKGLFKSKPRTPVDIVRQTRDLLIYADQSSASLSDSKREEKVGSLFLFISIYFMCACVLFLLFSFN
jgi:calcium binding protein 39